MFGIFIYILGDLYSNSFHPCLVCLFTCGPFECGCDTCWKRVRVMICLAKGWFPNTHTWSVFWSFNLQVGRIQFYQLEMFHKFTLLESNGFAPEKNGIPKRKIVFQPSIFTHKLCVWCIYLYLPPELLGKRAIDGRVVLRSCGPETM